jgi:hypothetical protein
MRKNFLNCFTLVILAIVICGFNSFGQIPRPLPDITEAMNIAYASLKDSTSANKQIPPSVHKQVLYALYFFPELSKTKINFKLKKSKSGIISTRPTLGSIFRRSSKRRYLVIINDSTTGRRLPSFTNGRVNGQVGILGHELCHILYFQRKSGFGLIGLGIKHLSKRFMDNFENKTDSLDIERGLGFQLMDWKAYLDKAFREMNNAGGFTNTFSEPAKRERYMSIESIKRVMAKSLIYKQ